jgi:hypothetical protein
VPFVDRSANQSSVGLRLTHQISGPRGVRARPSHRLVCLRSPEENPEKSGFYATSQADLQNVLGEECS